MSTALLVAVLLHVLLLSITFGGQTFGLPGFKLPWKERRLGADDLQVMLAPLPTPAPARSSGLPPRPESLAKEANPVLAPENVSAIGSAVSSVSASPVAAPLPNPKPAAASAPAPAVEPVMTVKQPVAALPTAPVARQSPTHISETPSESIARDVAQPPVEQATQERVALDQAGLEQERQLAENLRQTELMAAAQREETRQQLLRAEAARAEQAAKDEAARLDAERQEIARQEQAKQEEKARQDAARQEQEKAEALRQEAARNEATRQEQARQAQLEMQRQERARQEAAWQEQAKQAQLEAQRQEALRQESLRQEALRQEQANQAEKARQAAEKLEQERADAARREAAKQDAAKAEQAKRDQALREKAAQEAEREERLKAIGKQLALEAAQRDAASRSTLPAASSLRRGWLFGRADANRDLVLYAEAMSQKIEKNMTFDMIREVIKQPHNRPTVTISVRADGTVEKVTFVTSSGVPAIDEAVRKIIASQAPYGAFPPSLARQYDVIEIRRTWIFDIAVRLE